VIRVRSIVLITLVGLPASLVAQVCGDDHAHPGTESRAIQLQANTAVPSFYFRTEDFVVFISPEEVLESLKAMNQWGPIANKINPLIHARLPLHENQDLFQFEMQDWSFRAITKAIVIDAIAHGNAAISNEGGVWSKEARIVQHRGGSSIDTIIYDGNKGRTKIIWQLDCIAN
jgi:hypothetical protein